MPIHNEMKRDDDINESTFHIHVRGLVQGVGFRPFVYKLANQFGVKGWVNNTTDGVHIKYNADDTTAQNFYNAIIQQAPSLSRIVHHYLTKIPKENFHSFIITGSGSATDATLMLTPDFAMCDACKTELHNPGNHRYQYPFITCTHCGPRYSILTALPYDRCNTSMHGFEMCEACGAEYNDAATKRHYSQTNSCEACGIGLEMYTAANNRVAVETSAILTRATVELRGGKIIAIKGIGGYLLFCDANNREAIKTLRERKHRPVKPFAVMFPAVSAIEKTAIINEEQKNALQSAVAPIVLLEIKSNISHDICMDQIAPGLSKIGAMVPYAPLFDLVLSRFGKPVIATSANISDAPIIFKNDEALQSLFDVADIVITNNREILVPQDDSVIQFTKVSKQKIIIRRSRGLAPSCFTYNCKNPKTILATGALLKSSFTLAYNKNVYVSQYLGDTQSFEAQQTYSATLQHFLALFKAQPEVILTDRHPQYFSRQFANELAIALHIRSIDIQHHKAHFAAVLAENNLLQPSAQPVLGVVWDGTGFGDDGNIWGGEFFTYENNVMERSAHFGYFPFISGDNMPRNPRISAVAACSDIPAAENLLAAKFTSPEWKLYRQMLQKNSLQCSSAGRIFDAVASLLNICDRQTFEGQAAMLLEERAFHYLADNDWRVAESYATEPGRVISTSSLMKQIIDDILLCKPVEFIAAKFHCALVQIIRNVADSLSIKKIAFSGGVFLNAVLVDLLQINLANDFELFFHKELSPNDENISFGQFAFYDNNIKSRDDRDERKKEAVNKAAFHY